MSVPSHTTQDQDENKVSLSGLSGLSGKRKSISIAELESLVRSSPHFDPDAIKMRNQYEIRGDAVAIHVRCASTKTWHECIIDLADLSRLLPIRITWYAQLARKGTSKWYVQGKMKDKTVMLHRFLLSATRGYEVHHDDNDGLNNRRSNIQPLTKTEHQEQHYQHLPEYFVRPLTAEYRAERVIAKSIQSEFVIGRQQAWRIRTGRTTGSLAAVEYRSRLTAANVRSLEELMLARPVENEKWGTRRVTPKLSNIRQTPNP